MSSSDPKVLLVKPEGAYGTDAVPVPATDAVLIRDDIRAPQLQAYYAERKNAKAFFGKQEQLVVGKTLKVGYDVEFAGAGVAGTAPGWAKSVRGCAKKETLLAAAHAGNAVAGAASTITLAAGASAVDNAYRPLRIRTTGGTGNGQVRIITGYVGATKVATVTPPWATAPDATTTYSIDAQAMYSPISAAIESVSIYFYYGDAVHKLLGARGDLSWKFPNMDIPLLSFDFEGLYGGIADDVYPAAVLTGFQVPLGVNNQNTSLVSVHGFAGKLYNLEGKLGNPVKYRNIPGAEDVLINDRDPSGSIEFEKPSIATKDFPTIVGTGLLHQISLQHGTVVGNKVSVDGIQVQLTNLREGNQDSNVTWMADTVWKPSATGNDEMLLCAF